MFEQSVTAQKSERDTRTEVMTRFLKNAKNIDALHGESIENLLKDEKSKQEFLKALSEAEFKDLINGINGILRGKDKDNWQTDGDEVVLSNEFFGNHIPPRAEDKEEILSEVFEGVQMMLKDQRSLQDIALLISANINAIHSFADGNGRTSRFVYTMLTKEWGKDAESLLIEVLGDRGNRTIDVNPSIVQRELEMILLNQVGQRSRSTNPDIITNLYYPPDAKITYFEEIPKDIQDEFSKVYEDHLVGLAAIFKFVMQQENREQYLRHHGERSVIRTDYLALDLSEEQIRGIIQDYWQLKKKQVELLIDCIVHPDKEEYQIVEDNKKMSLLEKFRYRIEEQEKKHEKS